MSSVPERAKTRPVVYLALLNETQQVWEGVDNLRRQENIIRAAGGEFTLAADAAHTDFIVFLESNNFKNWRHIPALLDMELVRAYPEKCYTLNYRANPVDFFPGVYTSLPRAQHQADWSRAGAYYLGNPNPFITEYENRPWNPAHLFCFRGAMSHPLRHRLLALGDVSDRKYPVTWVDRWFNHDEAEQRSYLQEIVDSAFALCPRGLATSSHRLYEVMRLGRVPVILADDWVPPAGPDWDSFSIRLAEDTLERIPSLLQELVGSAPIMGRKARAAWASWFSPEVVLGRQLAAIHDLSQRRRFLSPPNFSHLWRSPAFFRRHGWSLHQRIIHRIRRNLGW